MISGVTLRAAEMPHDLAAVQGLCWDYRDTLLAFDAPARRLVEVFYPPEAYTALMEALPERHARRRGIVVLAEQDGVPMGCGMYHPLSDEACEIKRVFVREALRGTGAGESLSRTLIEQAREDGYSRVLLDTNVRFTAARKLYEKLGFQQRGPYSEIPAEVRDLLAFYELRL